MHQRPWETATETATDVSADDGRGPVDNKVGSDQDLLGGPSVPAWIEPATGL